MPFPQTASTDLKSNYEREGYVILRGVWTSDRLSAISRDAERLLARTDLIDFRNLRCRWQNHCTTAECRFDAFDPIIDLSPPIAELTGDSRLLEILQAVFGEPACLFKDKLIYKPPGATGYALHQDYIAWPTFPKSFLSVVIPLDPATASNGCTIVYPGRHLEGPLAQADGDYHELAPALVDETTAVALELQPGDIAIFSGFTPHRSADNASDAWRRQLYLSFNALSDGGDQRAAHYREFQAWLKQKYAEYDRHETYFD